MYLYWNQDETIKTLETNYVTSKIQKKKRTKNTESNLKMDK
jgi:hypothetical protein